MTRDITWLKLYCFDWIHFKVCWLRKSSHCRRSKKRLKLLNLFDSYLSQLKMVSLCILFCFILFCRKFWITAHLWSWIVLAHAHHTMYQHIININRFKHRIPSGHIMVKRRWNNVIYTLHTLIQRCFDVVWPWHARWVHT